MAGEILARKSRELLSRVETLQRGGGWYSYSVVSSTVPGATVGHKFPLTKLVSHTVTHCCGTAFWPMAPSPRLAVATLLQRRLSAAASASVSARPALTCIGVDIATKHTGLAVVSAAAAGLLHHELISCGPQESTYAYARRVARRIRELHDVHTPLTSIGIEDFSKSFTPGIFRTQDLFSLAKLNSIVGYASWEATHKEVSYVMPSVARSYFGLKRPAASIVNAAAAQAAVPPSHLDDASVVLDTNAMAPAVSSSRLSRGEIKTIVWDYVAATFPAFGATLETSRTGSPRATNYDRSDAVLIAMYTLAMEAENRVLASPEGAACFLDFAGEALRRRRTPTSTTSTTPQHTLEDVAGIHTTWIAKRLLEPWREGDSAVPLSESSAPPIRSGKGGPRRSREPAAQLPPPRATAAAIASTYDKLRAAFSVNLRRELLGGAAGITPILWGRA